MPNTAWQKAPNSAKDALREAAAILKQAGIESAVLDARVLLEHVLGVTREELLANNEMMLSAAQAAGYQDAIEKRAARQPVSHITGHREFWGMEFMVTAATLDPRPDSETLIEAVLEYIPDRNASLRILDLGTGSGCLLISLLSEYKNASGVGVDKSSAALVVAQANAKKSGVASRAQFVETSWGEGLKEKFDVVISNPPYIPSGEIASLAPEVSMFEPRSALDGGTDGLDCYRRIVAQLPALLAPRGVAVFEIGMGQERELENIAQANDLQLAGIKNDMAGIARCVLVKPFN